MSMPTTAPTQLLGFRYMDRFRCIGADCPDDCCHGWDVPVDDASYARLAEAERTGALEGRGSLAELVQELPDQGQGGRRALRVVGADQRCGLLGDDRLCSLQARRGEEALPSACSSFPRTIGQVGEVAELTGSLGCPEVARLALLSADATEVVDLDEARLWPTRSVHGVVSRTLDPAHPWAATFVDVRGVMFQLAGLSGLPLPSRLYLMAHLANGTRPLYRRDGVDEAGLHEFISGMMRSSAIGELSRRALTAPANEPFALSVTLLAAGLRHLPGTPPAFQRIANRVLEGFGLDFAERDDPTPTADDVARIHGPWRERCEALTPADAARIDEILGRYIEHFWLHDWYTSAPSLWAHSFTLFVKIAVIRFLLIAHPALRWAPDAAARAAALDGVAVEVVYSFARTLDHAPGLISKVLGPLGEANLNTMEHAVALIRL